MSAALLAAGVKKRYGATEALRGVDLRVERGSVVGLLGPNGAGKSTLVKIACGLVRPTAGTVEVCGAPAGSLASRARLGYLAELFRFPGWLSADEVLRLHQRLARSRGGADERRRLLGAVGLEEERARRVATMSKGMQQRLGIAQALVGDPELVLLDEPTSALDPLGRVAVRGLLERLRADGVAVLVNSHLLTEIERVCDQVAILDRGRVIRAAPTAELLRPRGVTVATAAGVRAFPDAVEEDVPRIVRALVGEGADVRSVALDAPSIEDVYADTLRAARAPA